MVLKELYYLTVSSNLRKAGRFETDKPEVFQEFVVFLRKFGLQFKIVRVKDRVLIYFSKKYKTNLTLFDLHHLKTNKDAKDFYITNKKIGKFYGYPKCCIDFFCFNYEKARLSDRALLMKCLENTLLDKDRSNLIPFTNNCFSTSALYFHIPHSLKCKRTLSLSTIYFKILNKILPPEKMAFIISQLRKAVVINEHDFTHQIYDYTLRGKKLTINNKTYNTEELPENIIVFV